MGVLIPESIGAGVWIVLAMGAFLVGTSKGGVVGVGNLNIAVYALLLPSRDSVGVLLPILIAADLVAVFLYRRDASWGHVGSLLPWTFGGIVLGALALGQLNQGGVGKLIGVILLVMLLIQLLRRRGVLGKMNYEDRHSRAGKIFAGGTGLVAGFATMAANGAGPVMALYLLAMGLPKDRFIGTSAWFFLIVNLIKVPFGAGLGIIDMASLSLNLTLIPFAITGVLVGRQIARKLPQKAFEWLTLGFTLPAAIYLALA